MWKSIASNGLTLLIVILIGAGIAVGWGTSQYTARGPLEVPICVQVPGGSNFVQLSRQLGELEAVSSERLFRVSVDYAGVAKDLKAGSYLVGPGASMAEIVDAVTRGGQSTCGSEVVYRVGINRLRIQLRQLDPVSGRFVEVLAFNVGTEEDEAITEANMEKIRAAEDARHRIALAEGVTSWQVVESLKSIDILTGDVPTIPAEGRLAPDSYELRAGDHRLAERQGLDNIMCAGLGKSAANHDGIRRP